MKWIKPEVTALTCLCPLGGNLSLPRGVCFILAAFHCNGWSGAVCQSASCTGWGDHTKNMLYARYFLQDVRFDRNGKRQETGVRVHREGKKGRRAATYQSQERHFCSLLWDRDDHFSAQWGTIKSKDTLKPHTVLWGIKMRRAAFQFLCGNDKTDKYQWSRS